MAKKKAPFSFRVDDSDFKKSSWSDFPKKVCVQIASTSEGVAIRDSKDSTKTTLFFSHDEFQAFKKGVAAGEFG
jgi:hypothetical protein